MAQSNTVIIKFGVGAIDGQPIPKMTDITINKSISELELRASCDLSPWLTSEISKDWSGTCTVQVINPNILTKLLGGNEQTASGWQHVKDEAVTVAASVALANSPVLSGSVIVTADNGAKLFTYSDSGTPAVGQFGYLNADTTISGVVFNAGETETTAKATYAYESANAVEYYEDASDTTSYVSLYIAGCGEKVTDGTTAYGSWYFPRVKCTNFTWGATNGEPNISFDWKVVKPTDGQHMVYYDTDESS